MILFTLISILFRPYVVGVFSFLITADVYKLKKLKHEGHHCILATKQPIRNRGERRRLRERKKSFLVVWYAFNLQRPSNASQDLIYI